MYNLELDYKPVTIIVDVEVVVTPDVYVGMLIILASLINYLIKGT